MSSTSPDFDAESWGVKLFFANHTAVLRTLRPFSRLGGSRVSIFLSITHDALVDIAVGSYYRVLPSASGHLKTRRNKYDGLLYIVHFIDVIAAKTLTIWKVHPSGPHGLPSIRVIVHHMHGAEH